MINGKIIIRSNAGDRELRMQRLKSHNWPILRSMLWTLILVVICYCLVRYWGQKFPPILWAAPLYGPALWLQGAVQVYIPDKWTFNDAYLRADGSLYSKVYWRKVKSWHYDITGEAITVRLKMPHFGRKTFIFHRSHGEEYIIQLFSNRLEKSPENKKLLVH